MYDDKKKYRTRFFTNKNRLKVHYTVSTKNIAEIVLSNQQRLMWLEEDEAGVIFLAT